VTVRLSFTISAISTMFYKSDASEQAKKKTNHLFPRMLRECMHRRKKLTTKTETGMRDDKNHERNAINVQRFSDGLAIYANWFNGKHRMSLIDRSESHLLNTLNGSTLTRKKKKRIQGRTQSQSRRTHRVVIRDARS